MLVITFENDVKYICGTALIQRYLSKISSPLLNRMNFHIEVIPIEFNELSSSRNCENTKEIRHRVPLAKNMQATLSAKKQDIHWNAQISSKSVRKICDISDTGKQVLKRQRNE